MSFRLMQRIIESPGCAQGSAWSLLMAMAYRASDDGTGIWESIPNLSRRCGISPGTGYRAKDELLESGVVIDTGKRRGSGTISFRIAADRICPNPPQIAGANPPQDADGSEVNPPQNAGAFQGNPPQNAEGTLPKLQNKPVLNQPDKDKGEGDGAGADASHPGRAHQLALQFWELQGSPERHRKSIPAWGAKLRSLLAQEPGLDGLLGCLFRGDLPYWSEVCGKKSDDPMAFLLRKLAVPVEERGSIRQKHDELCSSARAAAARARRRSSPPKAAGPPPGTGHAAGAGAEPLWDLERLIHEQAFMHNLEGAREYFRAHRKKYEELHPEWLEELKSRRIYVED